MILSATTPEIRAEAADVFAFFAGMEERYCGWHPDHLLFRWIDPPAVAVGVRFRFEERIAGKLLRRTAAFTRVEPARLIEFAPVSHLLRLVLPRISFRINPSAAGLTVTQEIQIRIGPLAAWLNRRELEAVRVHMRQEASALPRLIARA